jgi:hypothetical protein
VGLPVLAGISCITGALIGAHCEFYLRDMKDLRLITVRCVVEGWLRWTIGSQTKTHKLGFHFRHSIRTLEKCLEHKKSLCYGRVWRVKLATQYTHDPRDGWGWIEESIGFNLDRGLYLTRPERDGARWALGYLKTALQVFTTLRSTFISPPWLIIIVRIGSKPG